MSIFILKALKLAIIDLGDLIKQCLLVAVIRRGMDGLLVLLLRASTDAERSEAADEYGQDSGDHSASWPP